MPSPFPGMDAYLEQPVYWSEFHSRLIVAIADTLAPSLRPRYYIRVETRTYLDDANDDLLVGIPDAAVVLKERYLEVRERGTDAVITVIEVLSPKNKRKGKGRDRYQQKRQTILGSLSHLIEIDLLRRYEPMAMIGEAIATDYRILISRSRQRPFADLYGFMLRELIPSFPLPLKPGDEELTVDLQAIVAGVYERAGYDLRIDYSQQLPPPMSEADQQWVEVLLSPLRG